MRTGRTTVTYDGVAYAPGRRFRVAREGLRLSGMVPSGPSAWSGWAQELHPGDIVTCTGYGPGWGSDPGYGVEFATEQSRSAHAGGCEIRPSVGGVFAYRPPPGALVPVRSEDDDGA
jgi:hypothetical protein